MQYDDFYRVDIRVGTIVSADTFEESHRPAFKLQIDFGSELGIKKAVAQITENYQLPDLVGKQVAAVVNFPIKQIGAYLSEALIVGFLDSHGDVVLVSPDKPVPNGGRLH